MASIIKVDTIQTAAGGTPTAADLGIDINGNVLQVKYASHNTEVTLQSGTYTDTGLSIPITVKQTGSKIVGFSATALQLFKNAATVDIGASVRILRDSTVIFTPGTDYEYYWYPADSTNGNVRTNLPKQFEDTHGQTAGTTLTYKSQFIAYNGSAANNRGARAQHSGNVSTMLIMEIAG